MFDIGWVELLFVAVLALVIVGPRDLPEFVRTIGRLLGKARRLYRESLDGIHRLEREVALSNGGAAAEPDYYALLPEHVQAMLRSEMKRPDKDPAGFREQERIIDAAIAEAKAQLAGAGLPDTSADTNRFNEDCRRS